MVLGGKFQGGWDGGIRLPTVVMWPGVIPPGSVIDSPTWQMDIHPTLAEIIGECSIDTLIFFCFFSFHNRFFEWKVD